MNKNTKNNKYLKSKTISYQHLLIELFFNGKLILPVFIEIYMIPPCIPRFIWDLRKIVVIYFVVGKALNAFMKYPIRIWFDVMKHVIIIHDNNNADSYSSASIKGNLPYSNVSYDAHNLLILRGNNITITASKNKVTWFCENNSLFVSGVEEKNIKKC